MEVAISWIAVSAAAVCCYWMKLRHTTAAAPSAEDWKQMQDELDEVKNDVNAVYSDVAERMEHLTDRLEFAERLLTKPARETESIREHTPV